MAFRTSADGPNRLLLVLQRQNVPTCGALTGSPAFVLSEAHLSAVKAAGGGDGPTSAPQSCYVSLGRLTPAQVHISDTLLLIAAGARCGMRGPDARSSWYGGVYRPVGTQVLTPLRCAGHCGCV